MCLVSWLSAFIQPLSTIPDLSVLSHEDCYFCILVLLFINKFLLVIGPCSADREDAVIDYIKRLREVQDKVFDKISKSNPDIVLVALGIPLQEKLIYKHLSKFKKGIFVGVGGSFDVISGHKKRAPKLLIKLNLEWLYRIAKEPKRIKRFYNSNVRFIFKVRKLK